MEISKEQNESNLVVSLTGRLDTTTAPQLEEALNSSLDGIKELVINCANLEYVSSAGLRVILAFHKKMAEQGNMKVTSLNDEVKEVFDMTGFTDILNIE